MKSYKLSLFIAAVLVISAVQKNSFAIGILFSRPVRSSDTYNKVWIKSVDATVEIDGQIAVTYVDQTFRNEMSTTVEAVWIFPLPEGAVMTELYYWFNGKRYKADVREQKEARQAYESKIRQMLDPALLEYIGDNLFRLSIAPINANTDVRTEITFVQMLPYEFGAVGYTFLMDAVGLSPKPLNRMSINGVIETQSSIKYLRSPSHALSTAMQIIQINDKKYEILFGDENFVPDKDLRIEYETIRGQVEVNVLRYTPIPEDSIGTDSYFAVWVTPPDTIAEEGIIPKKIVFTADVSSSMEGLRIEQLKTALNAFLDILSPNDKFNIITFGTTVVPYKPDLVAVTETAIDSAKLFVTDIGAVGLTNIDEAMQESLHQSFSEDFANMIVFITDGYPTWGEISVLNILQNVQECNTKNVRIFPFGVGDDVSKPLLVQMGVENGGYATFIEEDDSIAAVVNNHFTRISKPVLTDLEIQISGLITSDKFPRPMPDLFWGSQVEQLGIYQNSGTFTVTLTGTVRGQEVSFQAEADFDTTPGGHRFVPRLWADAKIDFLLDQIAIYGELDELVNQVIELSLKYQILTPYTAFYSDPDEDPDNTDPTVVDVDIEIGKFPKEFTLHQNYPNPFNPKTKIQYELPVNGFVKLKIYDLNGRLVKILVNEFQQAGDYHIEWNGTDLNGRSVPSGIYICRMNVILADGQKFVQSKKMNLVR